MDSDTFYCGRVRSVGPTAREERVRHQTEGKVGPRVLQSSAVEAPGVGDGVEHLDGLQVVSGPLPGVPTEVLTTNDTTQSPFNYKVHYDRT